MPTQSKTKPVEDTVAKVNGEFAVGEDLIFQRKWWKFSTGVWTLFTILLAASLLGLLGRGPLAKSHRATNDGALDVDYEKVQRYGTPSVMKVRLGPNAVRDGQVRLWVSDTLFQEMGSDKISPQPASSVVGSGGVWLVFADAGSPAKIQITLQPVAAGRNQFEMKTLASESLRLPVLVMP